MKQNAKIHPDKSRGQNFLADKNVLRKIIEAAELKPSDIVMEIGAGTGVLTVELAKKVKKVISFEIDKKLIPALKENLKGFDNVEIVEDDILKYLLLFENLVSKKMSLRAPKGRGNLAFSEQTGDCFVAPLLAMTQRGASSFLPNYKLVANIPYNITSSILEKFLSAKQPPELIVLLVQKEVAERICAQSGEMSILSVMAQYYGEPKIVAKVPPSAFLPAPKVDSAILKIIIKKRWPADDEKKFFQIVKAGFSQRRKMLKNNLRALADEKKIAAAMREAVIAEKVRAQELGAKQWVSLAKKSHLDI